MQPELLFSMQGVEQVVSGGTLKATGTSSINYINLPIMAKFYLAEKLSIHVGPQLGLVVSATDKLVSNVPGFPSSTTEAKDDYNSFDFGLNLGAGFNFTKNITLDLRYNIGLTQFVKEIPTGSGGGKNRVFSLNLGYSF